MNTIKTLGIFLILILFSWGCARSLTNKSLVKTIEFKLTLREDVDPNNYQYIIAFSNTSEDILFPKINDASPYFPTPGRRYDLGNLQFIQDGGISYLYQNYFYTWKDYVVFFGNKIDRYKGSATGFSKDTQNNLSYLVDQGFRYGSLIQNGNTLIISFDLMQLSWLFPQLLDSDILFFKFSTLEKIPNDDSESGKFMDVCLGSPSIFLRKTELVKNSEISNPFIKGPADIISWQVQIY
jgi:hypothetical protein